MSKIIQRIEKYMDNFKIKKKLFILYVFCVLLPLFVTDSYIIYVVVHAEQAGMQHRMENVVNAVQYSFTNSISNADDLANSVYMNKYINEFINKRYESHLEYVTAYQNFSKSLLVESGMGSDNIRLTLYSDNSTIIRGGGCGAISDIEETEWYLQMEAEHKDKGIFFLYDTSMLPSGEAKRKVLFVRKMNYYNDESQCKKLAVLSIDYNALANNLSKMNYEMPVYICSNDQILLSNTDNSIKKDFQIFSDHKSVGYSQTMELFGTEFTIYVMKSSMDTLKEISKNAPVIILLVLVNVIMPYLLGWAINRSFTTRIGELSNVFEKIDDDKLVKITDVRGKDEIGSLMNNYNRMVERINSLIQIVYISKMKEQEMTVARKNAELLALHSQINPHFLFNALESIRMHSVLKKELETADMVEKLALLQRQYLEWGDDFVEIHKEIKSVKDYLEIQKYRFGNKLSYSLEVAPDCSQYRIPKMTIITFVENGCVHGIENKSTAGWIFVRVYKQQEELCIEIEDTGCGMPEEDMRALESKISNADIEMLKDKGRVGIINACLRLKIMTQNKVTFELDGEEGIGMMICMKIPMDCL